MAVWFFLQLEAEVLKTPREWAVPMDFPTSLKLLHLFGVAVAACGILVFLREAGLRAFGAAPAEDRLRCPSMAMMVGVFLVGMTAGGLSTLSFFQASGLTNLSLLLARGASLACLSLSCIALHLYVRPLFASDEAFKAVTLGEIAAVSLIAAVASMSLSLWIATGLASPEIVSLGLSHLAQSMALMTAVLAASFTAVATVAMLMQRSAFAITIASDMAPQRKTPPVFEPAVFAPRRPAPRPHFEPSLNSRYSEVALHAAQ